MWTVRNLEKKRCILRDEWVRDNVSFVRVEGFRWGTWECDAADRPNIVLSNPDGFDPYDQDEEWELVSVEDGCWDEWEFPETMSTQDRESVLEAWASDYMEGLESESWVLVDSQYVLEGPLELIKS